MSANLTDMYRALEEENRKLRAANKRLREKSSPPDPCQLCGGVGAIHGWWLGTWKTCPACHGRGG